MKASRSSSRLRKYIPLYVMMIPCVCYFLIFKYLPMLGNALAFRDYSVTNGLFGSPWAKPLCKHFFSFFYSSYFSQLMRNTLSSILLALLLNEVHNARFRRSIQTIVYLPYFLSWVIIQGILNALFSQSSGLINQLIVRMGGKSIPIFNSNSTFFWTVILSSVWKNAGYGAIIHLAAMTGIDPSLYEAARIDGENRLQCVWHVTLSGIRSTIILIQNNYQNPITLRELARQSGYTTNYFGAMFSRRMGMRFRTYLNQVRLEHAYQLLQSTSMSAQEIMRWVGFSDYSYFSNLYKERFGVTPQSSRRREKT